MTHGETQPMNNLKETIRAPQVLTAVLLLCAALAAACIPARLARLIDVGVRSGGVEYATPLRIRASTMEDLQLFLPQDTASEARRAYELVSGVYVLHGTGEAKKLSSAFALPVLQYLRTSQQGVNTFAAIRAGLENGTLTEDDVRKQAQEAVDAMGELTPRARVEAAAAFVRTEYAVAGGDPDRLRADVITTELRRMALLLLAALACAFAASRLAPKTDAPLLRLVFPAALAFAAAGLGLRTHILTGLVLLLEAAALLFALWKLRPGMCRAVSFAACLIACAAAVWLTTGDVLSLRLAPGRQLTLVFWAMLSAAPGLRARSGKEARA